MSAYSISLMVRSDRRSASRTMATSSEVAAILETAASPPPQDERLSKRDPA
jgi:hypothetical protein